MDLDALRTKTETGTLAEGLKMPDREGAGGELTEICLN